MKFYLSFFVIVSTLSFSGSSQTTTFLKTYNAGNYGYSVREVNGSSLVVAGGTDFYYNFNWFTMSPIASTNIHFIKTTSNGTLTMEKILGIPGSRTLATWMEPLGDSGYIITGRSNHETVWPPDSNDIILVKTDLSGIIKWSKVYDTGKDELGFCVRPTFDSGFIISGFHDAMPFSLTGTTYAMLIKTDSNGNILWDKKYELAVRDLDTGEPFPWVVRQTSDSGYVLVGTTAGSHAADVYVIRTNSSGDVIWAKSYEHDNTMISFSVGLDIVESTSGDFIIAGSMDKDQSLNQYNYPYILKISSTGTIINVKYFDSAPPQIFQSGFSSVEQTPDGGFFFTGMGGYSGFGMLAQLLKTDVNFNVEWSRTYSNDGAATVGSRSGRRTSDGGYIFTGKKVMAGSILMKTDNFGLISCKNPGSLVEMIPGVIVQNRFPLTLSGINASPVVMTSQPHLTDTTTLCPISVSALPIELLSFSAYGISGNQVKLQWSTATETNNEYFIIRKSTDGNSFSEAGRVKGAGQSKVVKDYSLIDENFVTASIVYYQLEQVDYDGRESFSEIIPVKINSNDLIILQATADYQQQTVSFYLESKYKKPITYTFTNVLGKIYKSKSGFVDQGIHFFTLDVSFLPKGIYILSVSDGVNVCKKKIIY